MGECLKTYRLELITKGPVFIGDGKIIKKKEYIRKGSVVYIPDIEKMYVGLCKKNLGEKYEDFLMGKTGENTLDQWMSRNRLDISKYPDWIAYTLEVGDLEYKSPMQISTFVKDPYGKPFIPGSSLKGALRTILLAYECGRHSDVYRELQKEIVKEAKYSKDSRKKFLKKQAEELEIEVFHKLGRLNNRKNDKKNAVNDIMSCIRISDSRYLEPENLVLCQKIDLSITGKMHSLNMVRECIKPGVKIVFDMTIDEKFPYTIDEINEAIKNFAQRYFNSYYNYFTEYCKQLEKIRENSIWLGGGAGFVSKTVVYSLLYKKNDPDKDHTRQNVVRTVANILEKTVRNPKHGHSMDFQKGVSPHVLKVTRCQGRIYEFGQCQLKILGK